MSINKESQNDNLYGDVKNNMDKINFYLKENKNKEASKLCDETFDMIKDYKSFYKRNEPESVVLLYNLYHAKVDSLHSIEDEEKKLLYLKNALNIVVKTNNAKWFISEYRNYISELLRAGKVNQALKTVKKFQIILTSIEEEFKLEKLKEMIKNNSSRQEIIECTGYTEEEIDGIKKIMILVKDICEKND